MSRRTSVTVRSALALSAAVFAACSPGTPGCFVDADCASFMCNMVTNTCLPLEDAGSRPDAGPAPDAGPVADAGPVQSQPDSGPTAAPDSGTVTMDMPDSGPMTCALVGGTIQAAEVPLQAGLHATFRVAFDAGVDTTGTTDADGGTTWDFSTMLAGDTDVVANLDSLSGQWFANSFPTATYATQLSQKSDLLGVFQMTSDALLLQGLVSPTEGSMPTNVSYDPPVTVLQFPLKVGASWQTISSVTGVVEGIDAAYSETYTMNVDAQGTAITPYASFPVLRVNTLLDQPIILTQTRQFAFVAPCFGPVVTIISEPNEIMSDFTTASEIERLAP